MAHQLSEQVSALVREDGETALPASGLKAFRFTQRSAPAPCLNPVGLSLVLQGEKTVFHGKTRLELKPGSFVIALAELPLTSAIVRASPSEPYLALWAPLPRSLISEVSLALMQDARRTLPADPEFTVHTISAAQSEVLSRLLTLRDDHPLHPHLLPLYEKELMLHLMQAKCGPALESLVSATSPCHRIVQAVDLIRQDYDKVKSVDSLARSAHMSASAFRSHFRSFTGLNPLQYLKQFRLFKARELMIAEGLDVSRAAFRVGYESASQFSREYKRLFGEAPRRDIQRLKLTS